MFCGFLGPVFSGCEDGGGEGVVLGEIWLCGDAGGEGFHDFFGECGVCMEVGDDGGDIDGGFVVFPAIVIGDEAECGEGDFCFAAEACFWGVCHADEVGAEGSVHV